MAGFLVKRIAHAVMALDCVLFLLEVCLVFSFRFLYELAMRIRCGSEYLESFIGYGGGI